MAGPEDRGDGSAAVVAGLLAVGTGAALVALCPAYLYHWDEVQLRLALERVDLIWHEPHPPGYYGFVLLARVLSRLCPAGFEAGRAVSILAAALFAFVVARRIAPAGAAGPRQLLQLVPALFVVLSPTVAFFAVAHLTYVPEGVAWVALLLAAGSRPTGRTRLLLAFSVGLAASLRPTLLIFSLALLAGPWLRTGGWRAREVLVAAALCAAGVLSWWLPLVIETGGLRAYLEATAALGLGNVFSKSIFAAGPAVAAARAAAMGRDVLAVVGWSLPLSLWALWEQRRGRFRPGVLEPFSPLPAGAAIAFGFYALVIYDSPGYGLAVVLPLAAHGLLSAGALVATTRERGAAFALAGCAGMFAIGWSLVLRPVDIGPAVYARHDRALAARFEAVRQRFPADETLLVTSREYWRWGLRHVMYYAPEYSVLQLDRDRFFVRATEDAPYLVARDRTLGVRGPDPLDPGALQAFASRAELRHVVYLVPWDARERLAGSCAKRFAAFDSGEGGVLHALTRSADDPLRIEAGRFVCAPSRAG